MSDGEPGTDTQSTGVPWHSRTVQVVLASTALAPLGVPLISPTLPIIRDAFAVTDAQASLLISAYFAAGIVLSPFIGILADRFGRRRVLLVSLFVFGLTGGVVAFASDFGVVLAIRLVQGTAAAGIFITTVTVIGDTFEGVQRNAVLGVNVAILSLGAAVYPIVGGALVAFGWNAPFLAYLLAVPVALFAAWVLEEPIHEREALGLAYLRGAARSLSGRGTWSMYLATFAAEALFFGAVFTALPFYLTESFALAPVLVGVTLTVAEGSSVIVSSQNGRLARRISNGRLVAAGFVAFGVGLVGSYLAPSPAVVGLSALLFGAGPGLILPSVDAGITSAVATRYRAGVLSLRNSTTFLGRATGPVLFAALAAFTGYRTLLLVAGIVAVAGGVVALPFAARETAGGVAPEETA